MASSRHDEIAYLLNSLRGGGEELCAEAENIQSDIYDGAFPRKTPPLSPIFLQALKETLRKNTLAGCRLIVLLHNELETEQKSNIKTAIAEQVNSWINESADSHESGTRQSEVLRRVMAVTVYMRNGNVFCQSDIEDFLSRLNGSLNSDNKKMFFTSLVSLRDTDVIRALLRRDADIDDFDHRYVFQQCFESSEHWLLKQLKNLERSLMGDSSAEFNLDHFSQDCLMLIVINIFNNGDSLSLDVVEKIFSLLSDYRDDLEIYRKEIGRQIRLLKFCYENPHKVTISHLNNITGKSALHLISKNCHISMIDRHKILSMLELNITSLSHIYKAVQIDGGWERDTYNKYCILKAIVKTICDSNVDSIGEIKSYLSLLNYKEQISMLEDITSAVFMRTEHCIAVAMKKSTDVKNIVKKRRQSCRDSLENTLDDDSNSSRLWNSYEDSPESNVREEGLFRSEFVCSPLVMEQIFQMLKEVSVNLVQEIRASAESPVLESRVTRFLKILSELRRRFSIVSAVNLDVDCIDVTPTYMRYHCSSGEEQMIQPLRQRKHKVKKARRKSVSRRSKSNDVDDNSKKEIISTSFIPLMVSSPSTLVGLAFYNGDLTNAQRIIETYNLDKRSIVKHVMFTKNFKDFIIKLKNTVREIEQSEMRPTKFIFLSATVISIIETFLGMYRSPLEEMGQHSENYISLVTLTDILISFREDPLTCATILKICKTRLNPILNEEARIPEDSYLSFWNHVIKCMDLLNDRSFCDYFNDARLPLQYKALARLVKNFNLLRESSKVLTDDPCSASGDGINDEFLNLTHLLEENILHLKSNHRAKSYMRNCFYYVKTISECMNTDEVKMNNFSVLSKTFPEIINYLVHDRKLQFEAVESMCKRLNVSFISNLALCFTPPITSQQSLECKNDSAYKELVENIFTFDGRLNDSREMESELLHLTPPSSPQDNYMQMNNWVIALLLKRMFCMDGSQMSESFDARTLHLNAFLNLERNTTLSPLYGSNKTLAALHSTVDVDLLFKHFKVLIGEGKFDKCLDLLSALPDYQMKKSKQLNDISDILLAKLVSMGKGHSWQYAQRIKDFDFKVDCVLNNMLFWSAENVLNALNYLHLSKESLHRDDLRVRLVDWIKIVTLCLKVSKILNAERWQEVYKLSTEEPDKILQELMDRDEYEACLDWSEFHPSSVSLTNLITLNLFKKLLVSETKCSSSEVNDLMGKLSVNEVMEAVSKSLDLIAHSADLDVLQICLDFLIKHSTKPMEYENLRIGLMIIMVMSERSRTVYRDLIGSPLLIIEQLLMNAQIRKLSEILRHIGPQLRLDLSGDSLYYNPLIEAAVISRNAVDSVLRLYAKKALEVRARRRQSISVPVDKKMSNLLVSLDSINVLSKDARFVMPVLVPRREEWVPDKDVNTCMACRQTIFSLLIRRHHCRRCGRVVCYSCSRNRLVIPSSNNEKVRVCDDCHRQTIERNVTPSEPDTSHSSSHSDSIPTEKTSIIWMLSTSRRYNNTVRKEFEYMFIPNVTLCLTIMSLHSVNLEYPRFLLDRSDEMVCDAGAGSLARLMQSVKRILLIAAVELYARWQGNPNASQTETRLAHTGFDHAQNKLAHVDTMESLMPHSLHNLPPEESMPSHYVRHLLEAEQWEVALELATKTGLPRKSILAAWGKACLRAGCFKQAREKFSSCFKSAMVLVTEVVDDFVMVSEWDQSQMGSDTKASKGPLENKALSRLKNSSSSMSTSRTSICSSPPDQTKLRENTPILDEIISILENNLHSLTSSTMKKYYNALKARESLMEGPAKAKIKSKTYTMLEPSLNVMQRLDSISKIRTGDFSDFYFGRELVQKPKSVGLIGYFKKRDHSNRQISFKRKLEPIYYEECLYYLTTYGSHIQTIKFLMKHDPVKDVLYFCINNAVDVETFTNNVYMPYSEKNKVNDLMSEMNSIDTSWNIWTKYILHICRTLEVSHKFTELYALQTITDSHARAAATCVRLFCKHFPSETEKPFTALHDREIHLGAAKAHLLQCVPRSAATVKRDDVGELDLPLDRVSLEKHLNTIGRQFEVDRFFKDCEKGERIKIETIAMIVPPGSPGTDKLYNYKRYPLTLFGSQLDRTRLANLLIVCGKEVADGFILSQKIIQEYNLDTEKVYSFSARYLVNTDRYLKILKLTDCIRKIAIPDSSKIADQILEVGVAAIVRRCDEKGQMFDEQAEVLIQDVQDISSKIRCYIECRILKTAYILASKHGRVNDLKKILREAERLGQEQVINACRVKLSLMKQTVPKRK